MPTTVHTPLSGQLCPVVPVVPIGALAIFLLLIFLQSCDCTMSVVDDFILVSFGDLYSLKNMRFLKIKWLAESIFLSALALSYAISMAFRYCVSVYIIPVKCGEAST